MYAPSYDQLAAYLKDEAAKERVFAYSAELWCTTCPLARYMAEQRGIPVRYVVEDVICTPHGDILLSDLLQKFILLVDAAIVERRQISAAEALALLENLA